MEIDQHSEILWYKLYGGIEDEVLRSISSTTDGGFILVGWTKSYTTNSTKSDFYVVKTDSLGNMEWENHYGNENTNDSGAIWQTEDGGYVFVKNGTGLIKIDSGGEIEWEKDYLENESGDVAQSGVLCMDKGYALTGRVGNQAFILKADKFGNVIWEQKYSVDNEYSNPTLVAITELKEGGFIAAGSVRLTNPPNNFKTYDAWMIRTDIHGSEMWQKTYRHRNSVRDNYLYDVIEDIDGSIIACGTAFNPPPEGSSFTDGDAWILKVDADGNDKSALGVGFDEGVTACVGNPEFIAAYPYGGSEDYVQHEWRGEKINWLIGTDVREPIVVPTDTGTYTFQYSVTDSEGNTAMENLQITVFESPSTAFFNSQITVEVGHAPLLVKSHTSGGLPPYTHQWVGTGASFLNFTDQEFVGFHGAPVGNYELTYIVTDANGCTAFDVLPIVVEDTTTVDIEGVELALKEAVLKVYPNPVREVLQLEVSEEVVLKGTNLLFYNALGQLVERMELKEGKQVLEVSDWKKGVYFYRLENGLRSGKILCR